MPETSLTKIELANLEGRLRDRFCAVHFNILEGSVSLAVFPFREAGESLTGTYSATPVATFADVEGFRATNLDNSAFGTLKGIENSPLDGREMCFVSLDQEGPLTVQFSFSKVAILPI